MEETLETFEGTIIGVSHDRYFLQKIFTKVAWIEHETIQVFEGDYEWARQKRLEVAKEPVIKEVPEKPYAAKKEILIEEQIEKLEMKLQEPTLAKEQRQKLEQQLEDLYERWIEGGTKNAKN